ncbi:MAG: TetR/AcrR family transcriptional regulator, partial [Proteobacteria bacterium]
MIRKRSDQDSTAPARRAPSGAAVMQPAVTDALTRELFGEWAERGYAAISLERVALRAGVGKAALYRRWPSKLVSSRANSRLNVRARRVSSSRSEVRSGTSSTRRCRS